jgi:cob(I)alamin adenosyltransferase
VAIYTKKGDRGETSLFDKDSSQRKKTSKADLTVEAMGAVDELNSYIGVIVAGSEDQELKEILIKIQDDLLRIGSITAGSSLRFYSSKTKKLENIIDKLEAKLPVLRNFIIPGGSTIASRLHCARSLSRRAERRMVVLNENKKVRPQILQYLNRLSDLLFMLARDANAKMGIKDTSWKARK